MTIADRAHLSTREHQPAPLREPGKESGDFPVVWDDPADAETFWMFDVASSPLPMPPLAYELQREFCLGFNPAAEELSVPLRFDTRRINTYLYLALSPPAASPQELEEMGKQSERLLQTAMMSLGQTWEREWLPAIQVELDWLRAFDLRTADMPALLAHLDEALSRSRLAWKIHFAWAFPGFLAISLFEDLYRGLFPGTSEFDSYQLLQGFDNKTLEGDRALWSLSRHARNIPAVRRVLEERLPGEVLTSLGEEPEAESFLREFGQYLEAYGHRCDDWMASRPRWAEDPARVVSTLQQYLPQPDRDPLEEMQAQVAARDAAVAEARSRLSSYPVSVREEFETMLSCAQQANVLTEEHAYWIDYGVTYEMRKIVNEIGRRLVEARVIERPEDVFFLTLAELRVQRPAAANTRELIAARKEDLEHFSKVAPPPSLGTEPSEPPPDDPLSRALMKFFGAPPLEPGKPNELRGNAGSPGVARGTAKVLLSLTEANKIEPGDVLVARATLPAWTPLFATVAAVVTDAGGVLSHCAIVAREYGIPAVVGTGNATQVVKDGDLIEVNGSAGVVTLH